MSNQENINLVRKVYEIFNQNNTNNLNVFDDVLAHNLQYHDAAVPNAKSGPASFKQAESNYIKAFPNKKIVIDDIFGTEDRVVVRWTATATNKGEFNGIAPSNREVKTSGIAIYQISKGKIVEIWQVWDRQGLLEQIEKKQYAHASH